MALDSRYKRESALDVDLPWRGVTPVADGVISADDRRVVGGYYARNEGATSLVVASPQFGAPAIGQVHALTAVNLIVSSPSIAIGNMYVGYRLTAIALTTSSPVINLTVLSQLHNLIASDKINSSPLIGSPVIGQNYFLVAVNFGVTGVTPVFGEPLFAMLLSLLAQGFVIGAPTFTAPDWRELFNPRVRFLRGDYVWQESDFDEDDPPELTQNIGSRIKEAIFTNYNDDSRIELAAKSVVGNDEDEHGIAKCLLVDAPLYLADRKLKIDLSDWATVVALLAEAASRSDGDAALSANIAAVLAELNAVKTDYASYLRSVSVGKGTLGLTAGGPVLGTPALG